MKKDKLSSRPLSKTDPSLLIVGADDSNHAGTSKGEIIVAVFSCYLGDSIVQDFRNIRDISAVDRWLSFPGRDYRFTLLTEEQYRHSSFNLPAKVPGLVRYHLSEIFSPTELKIYLDGRMESGAKENIRRTFQGVGNIERVVVDNFIKRRKNLFGRPIKHPRCPPVVYVADVLANHLNSLSFQQLVSHKKMVNL